MVGGGAGSYETWMVDRQSVNGTKVNRKCHTRNGRSLVIIGTVLI